MRYGLSEWIDDVVETNGFDPLQQTDTDPLEWALAVSEEWDFDLPPELRTEEERLLAVAARSDITA